MVSQKIIVCGFPHSGTTILKNIIGHIDDVEEIVDELHIINRSSNKKFIMCKDPFIRPDYFREEYKDYIKIVILRDPRWIFSSLNKRFNRRVPENHSIQHYIDRVNMFLDHKDDPDVYAIRYEDMFPDNYKRLREIFDSIGFKYTDKIFDNSKFENRSHSCIRTIPQQKPMNLDHARYRTYQINQPFVNNNDPDKIDLTDEQRKILETDPTIRRLYP